MNKDKPKLFEEYQRNPNTPKGIEGFAEQSRKKEKLRLK